MFVAPEFVRALNLPHVKEWRDTCSPCGSNVSTVEKAVGHFESLLLSNCCEMEVDLKPFLNPVYSKKEKSQVRLLQCLRGLQH